MDFRRLARNSISGRAVATNEDGSNISLENTTLIDSFIRSQRAFIPYS
ncbi:hypothetical protein NIES2104_35570 [Leptolyngbya sp. NIES-2104]|nr:hypothetical protein NIES2104_35570 [Leptolyngbya sp. NIES-2104]